MEEYEIWYRIARYEWAKENGLLDEMFPVVAKIQDLWQ